VKSRKVDAPLFKELPLALECTVEEMIEEDGGYILVGAVQGMSADERILTKGRIDLDKLKPIAFDSAAAAYRALGPVIAPAFKAGKAIK
jgi:flavin reductase (DIM6/NTAB) family NADH-FMN oxidoreductase RutF